MNKNFLLCSAFMLMLLTACGNFGSDAKETITIGEDVEGATELSFWTFAQMHTRIFENAITRWNEEFPDRPITLKAEVYPYDQMHNNLLMALQSGSGAPDIVDIELNRFPDYLQGQPQLEPMNDYVEPVRDNFIDSRFEIYSKDGQYYGMPTHVGATVMYYNEEIMNEAGVDIDSIETWNDYVEAGEKVVENTDAMMTTFETEDVFVYWSMLSQQDSDFIDDQGNLILDNEINIQTLDFMQELIHERGIAEIAPGGMHAAEEYFGYMNDGGAASVMMPLWYMSRFLDYMEDLEGKIQIRPLPAWEEDGNRSAGMGGTGTVVTNQAEDAELAKEFLAYAKLSEEGNIDLWKILGFDPPRWDVWESEAMSEDNEYFQYFHDDIFEILVELREEINPINITERTPSVTDELTTNVFNEVLRQGSTSAKEALEKAKQQIENRSAD
ncbi:ABC transporter substrate-binding protein [Alkalihalophilus lindianensis]|uniref:ABC transporter substrate-binding protein n=1 Tax=Alkalihalophilus lindianensis TaxID=1630542 RepID=A0ABU3XDC8_9BACI|nr:ABC transporter substrate-binding protein [Alkalihalophilus lindianensis]MDV2685637.1 ABC transporter substrate-binding protein [Alkalihalophilus lindianensis]